MTFAHLDDILAQVEPLGQLFVDAGYRLFLVGGIVRDQVLDEPLDGSSDIDLTTNALPSEIKRIVACHADTLWLQGEKFGTIGLRAGGRDYEITTHRAESYSDDSRKPQVSFGDDIHVDLSRRDFTVNAMAIELPDGELVDPYGGVSDLQAKVLRTPLSADISFTDDPLRMLRAARFSARFGLTPHVEVVESAARLSERLRIVAIERIGVELRKLLSLDNAIDGLRFLAGAGLLQESLTYGHPGLLEQVNQRLDAALLTVDLLPADWRLRLAGIGVRVFDDAAGVHAMCRRLKLSRDEERFITRTSASALAVDESSTAPSDVRRWIATCDDPQSALVLSQVVGADVGHVRQFQRALHELRLVEDLDNVAFVDGDTIMSTLSITPGPAVGQAHAMLRESYFESGPLTEAEQVELVRSWWTDRATNS